MSRTDDLLRQLSADLKPVRRIAPLRASAALVIGLWALAVMCEWRMGGARPAMGDAGRWHDPAYSLLFGGLLLAAGSGLVAVLAQRMPGRESLSRGAMIVAGAGAFAAVGAAGMEWFHAGAGMMGGLAGSWSCVMRSLTLAVMPAIAAAVLLRGHWRGGDGWRVPLFAAPLGALAVHASCVAGGAEHMLLGHSFGPVLAGVVFGATAWVFARLRQPAY